MRAIESYLRLGQPLPWDTEKIRDVPVKNGNFFLDILDSLKQQGKSLRGRRRHWRTADELPVVGRL